MTTTEGGWEPLNVTETTGGDVTCHNCPPDSLCALREQNTTLVKKRCKEQITHYLPY